MQKKSHSKTIFNRTPTPVGVSYWARRRTAAKQRPRTSSWAAVKKQPQPHLRHGRTGDPHAGLRSSKLTDPSLIIYAPVRVLGNKTIVTNGDQTDTIYAGMDRQLTFEQALRSREFEPDGPNFTPRISEFCISKTASSTMRCQS